MLLRLLLIVLLTVVAQPARAAESYDNCTGFIDTLPATLSTQGVWCLRHNLNTASTYGASINVAGNNITIDCNEFKIGDLAAGPNTSAVGIYAGVAQNITIRRCGIRGFWMGIQLGGGAGHLVEDNRLDQNIWFSMMVLGNYNVIQRNRVFDMGQQYLESTAIMASGDIVDNLIAGASSTATDYSAIGIEVVGNGGLVRGNRIRDMVRNGTGTTIGIRVQTGVGVRMQENHLLAPAPGTSIGIQGTSSSACLSNTVIGFATSINNCPLSSGNLTL